MSMEINVPIGTKIYFAYPHNGTIADHTMTESYLELGKTYTVKNIRIDSWSTAVELEEHPGVWFNSVMFEEERRRGWTSQQYYNEHMSKCPKEVS